MKKIKRNGRLFSMLAIKKSQGFTFEVSHNIYDTLIIEKNGEEYDDGYFLAEDKKYVYIEGEFNDFIYKILKSECPPIKKPLINDVMKIFENPLYSPTRSMTDNEIDILL
jgi:hypothetical protein